MREEILVWKEQGGQERGVGEEGVDLVGQGLGGVQEEKTGVEEGVCAGWSGAGGIRRRANGWEMGDGRGDAGRFG